MYYVSVAPDYRWDHARVSGRHFSKHRPAEIPEADANDEILHSPILVVEYAGDVETGLETDEEVENGGSGREKRRSRRN